MHCLACDVILTEEEQQRKFPSANGGNPEDQYVMLCNSCIGIDTEDDLSDDLGIIEDDDELDEEE